MVSRVMKIFKSYLENLLEVSTVLFKFVVSTKFLELFDLAEKNTEW